MPDLANDDVLGKQEQLIAKVKEKGGHAGNVTLQRELGWEEETYWPIRDRLVDSGLLGRAFQTNAGLLVPVSQPPIDGSLQFFDARECSAADHSVGDEAEEAFDLVQPGTAGRGEVKVEASAVVGPPHFCGWNSCPG